MEETLKTYVKKPLKVQATQVITLLRNPKLLEELNGKVNEKYKRRLIPCLNYGGEYILVNSPEGHIRGYKEDYIILGADNEVYPCKKEIFERTYNEVTK